MADSEELPLPSLPEQPAHQVVNTANSQNDGLNKCPKCGSTEVTLSIEKGMLQCHFCRNVWASEELIEAIGFDSDISLLKGLTVGSGAAQDATAEIDAITIKCSACGAEVVIHSSEAVNARCHWCRQTLSLNEQIANGAVPDAVLPFKLTKEEAIAKIHDFADKREFFAHKQFKKEFAPENVLGVYLPYMVIDGNLYSELRGHGEIETRRWTETHGSGDNRRTVTYYAADVYEVGRAFNYTVDDLQMESSTSRADMNTAVNTNNIINAILPFDTKNVVRFDSHYLQGFSSEKRDSNVENLKPLVADKFLSIARSEAEKSVRGYDRGVRWEEEHLAVHGSRWLSVYLPVWLYSYYEDRGEGEKPFIHYIAVNARTGSTMGSVPINKPLLLGVSLTIAIVLFILTAIVLGVASL